MGYKQKGCINRLQRDKNIIESEEKIKKRKNIRTQQSSKKAYKFKLHLEIREHFLFLPPFPLSHPF